MAENTQKHGYMAPEIDFLALELTGGGFCTSGDITDEAKESYGFDRYNWE